MKTCSREVSSSRCSGTKKSPLTTRLALLPVCTTMGFFPHPPKEQTRLLSAWVETLLLLLLPPKRPYIIKPPSFHAQKTKKPSSPSGDATERPSPPLLFHFQIQKLPSFLPLCVCIRKGGADDDGGRDFQRSFFCPSSSSFSCCKNRRRKERRKAGVKIPRSGLLLPFFPLLLLPTSALSCTSTESLVGHKAWMAWEHDQKILDLLHLPDWQTICGV